VGLAAAGCVISAARKARIRAQLCRLGARWRTQPSTVRVSEAG
jgi:hypothetical protein